MNEQTWLGTDGWLDLTKPSAARVYDYLLGGGHNFEADRVLAEQLRTQVPGVVDAARLNRAFLRRTVCHLVACGVRQFLDLGSGIPTAGNVHEIAHSLDPECTVVYVDNDPVAISHSRLTLKAQAGAAAVLADLRDVDGVLTHPTIRAMLDFDRPVAVLMCAVLHFVSDGDCPGKVVCGYVDAISPGSYVAISHATGDADPHDLAAAVDLYRDAGVFSTARGHTAVVELFAGLELILPGVVWTSQWRPEWRDSDDPRRSLAYAGLGIKPNPRQHCTLDATAPTMVGTASIDGVPGVATPDRLTRLCDTGRSIR